MVRSVFALPGAAAGGPARAAAQLRGGFASSSMPRAKSRTSWQWTLRGQRATLQPRVPGQRWASWRPTFGGQLTRPRGNVRRRRPGSGPAPARPQWPRQLPALPGLMGTQLAGPLSVRDTQAVLAMKDRRAPRAQGRGGGRGPRQPCLPRSALGPEPSTPAGSDVG